ncbi:MAG TPA: amidohydrolase family protein [Streptosporangiaceae bacterium]
MPDPTPPIMSAGLLPGGTGQPVRFRRVTVVDGTGAPPVPDQWVLVENGRIAALGPEPAADGTSPRLTDIDAPGCTLLPGLINCHVHLCHDGPPDLVRQLHDDKVPLATLRAVRNLVLALQSGVTTVRDCGATDGIAIALAQAVADGGIVGPRILAAGRVITMTGGHGHFMGLESDGADAVRRSVRTEMKGGAHFIKAMATGGVLTPGVEADHSGLSHEELLAVARTAHESGRRTATHAIGGTGIKNALRAGIDSIEHGFHLDDEALELAVDQGTFLVPTLVAIESILDHAEDGVMPDFVVRKARREAGAHHEAFARAVAAGVNIAAGTDAGTPFNLHSDLPRELALMVRLGMSPGRAIAAATSQAAANLGVRDSVGTVEAGKVADLLLVDGDPTADIGALTQVAAVMRAGRLVHRALRLAPEPVAG